MCRRHRAVNVIAKFNGNPYCTVNAVTVKTPIEGYNSPVAQVIVFASLGKLTLVTPNYWQAFDGIAVLRSMEICSSPKTGECHRF